MPLHPVDVHVGKQLRARRTLLGKSQEELGEAVGITFQQIQKYERGHNRIGSSRLYELSRILHVDVAYFFEGLHGDALSSVNDNSKKQSKKESEDSLTNVANKEVLTLVRAYYNINNPVVQKKILSLVKSLSSMAFPDEEDPKASRK